MTDRWHEEPWARQVWFSGQVTRRRWLGLGAAAAGAIGATLLVPPPWRAAFGRAKPYKIGSLQPLSGTAAAGGKTALVGTQMAVDRINQSGGINGRPVELIVVPAAEKQGSGPGLALAVASAIALGGITAAILALAWYRSRARPS